MTQDPLPPTITLNATDWQHFLDSLYERDDRLERRAPDTVVAPDEEVDAYTLSAHVEALRSGEVDGDVWGTLEDIEETAGDEEEAWTKITAFYRSRGCVLVQVLDQEEPEEWLLSEALARRLGLQSMRGSGEQEG
ncbi:hypothetical protein [Deinococcus aerophilus]|uniref:Uncharacterized protein n=1 Tax=Deinococcus aerophilus TaxID=522488 RepID=A0ABQ2GKB5_9DEIO|nr:hypothetical protein [Deinococcus aerophilus]GGL99722.1 hypothetical protein GCM10010841_05410 [Deinococcus aerophilus]